MRNSIIIMFLLVGSLCWAADVTPPDGAIIINNNPNAVSRTVQIIVPAGDTGSGVRDMCVSVGTTCTAWQPYVKTATVYLSGTIGNWFSICVKVRDAAGNESQQQCVQTQLTGE